MDDSPVKRLLQRNGGRMMQAAMQEEEQVDIVEEVTLLPEDPEIQEGGADDIVEELECGDEAGMEDCEGELTHNSAFEDSLLYTSTSVDDFDIPDLSHVPEWNAEEPFALTSTLDGDGLLCDACDARFLEERCEAAHEQGDQSTSEVDKRVQETSPAGPLRPQSVRAPEAEVARLTAQISRLYVDVVRDLDARARNVWDELYSLFQDKMAVDMTDEDQNEIEAFIFEHLPTESTDLIWKVYKVLHLEQERDRLQRLSSGVPDSK